MMGKRQIAALQTRRNVIAAAEKLIAEKGFDKVTINDIAEEAGVAVGTFYTYFKRKEDVVGEIWHSEFVAMEEKTMAAEGDAVDKIGLFLTDSMTYIVDTGRKIAQQWVKNVVEPPEEGGKTKLLYDLGVIRDILTAAVASGELREDTPVEQLHQWITYEYYGIVTCWCILDGAIDPVSLLAGYCQEQLRHSLAVYRNG